MSLFDPVRGSPAVGDILALSMRIRVLTWALLRKNRALRAAARMQMKTARRRVHAFIIDIAILVPVERNPGTKSRVIRVYQP